MSSYRQLSIEERCEIARLHEAGFSLRKIAAALDRQPSTVSRELKRNRGSQVGYRPAYAQAQAEARRWSGSRLERDDDLRETVLDRLADGWSPEQVAGRLAREAGRRVISHETIYRFVHAQMKRTNDVAWRRYLPRGKLKRGWRNKGGVENAIGRLRRDIPRKTNLDALPKKALDTILWRYNNTPRKCLGFQTPAETFLQPLHFKCESTPGTRPG